MERFDVRPRVPGLRSSSFSGGNQQKLVLAREMAREPKVLLVGQPTRGVDIGAIEFIHRELVKSRDAGCAVLVVSVELDEILSLADRILVMFAGRIVGEVAGGRADERTLGLMMAGAKAAPALSGAEGRVSAPAAAAPGPRSSLLPLVNIALAFVTVGIIVRIIGVDPFHALELLVVGRDRLARSRSATRSTTRPTSSSPASRSPSPSMPACSTSAARARPISAGWAAAWRSWRSTATCRPG